MESVEPTRPFPAATYLFSVAQICNISICENRGPRQTAVANEARHRFQRGKAAWRFASRRSPFGLRPWRQAVSQDCIADRLRLGVLELADSLPIETAQQSRAGDRREQRHCRAIALGMAGQVRMWWLISAVTSGCRPRHPGN
jgi:hypothetical protein